MPGVKGLSSNITVQSIVDRFLEHSRVYYFENACQPQVFAASADWMKARRFKEDMAWLSPRAHLFLRQAAGARPTSQRGVTI